MAAHYKRLLVVTMVMTSARTVYGAKYRIMPADTAVWLGVYGAKYRTMPADTAVLLGVYGAKYRTMPADTAVLLGVYGAKYRTMPADTAVLLGGTVTMKCAYDELTSADTVCGWARQTSNSSPRGKRNEVFLTVRKPVPAPPDIDGGDGPVIHGHSLLLSCVSYGGHPLPRLEWYNGTRLVQSIRPSEQWQMEDMVAKLSIRRVSRWENGVNYTCKADQGFPDLVKPVASSRVLDIQSLVRDFPLSAMAKPKVCSVCTMPVRGHRGPHGRGKCTAGLSSGSDNNSDSLEERVRRSLKKLKRDSKAKELAKGLWSEASEEERAPTARDLREDDDLADRVDKTLDEIFGKKPRKRSSSRRKDRKDTSPSSSRSRSPDAARSRRRLKNIDDLLGKRPVSSRKRSSSDSTTSSTSRSRSTDGSRSRRRRSNDHKCHRRRHRSAHRRRHSSDSRSSSSPRRRRRGKKSGRTKTINDSASSRVKIEWPHHHVHFPGKGKGGDGCVTYDDLSTSMFVHGFVKNLLEKKHVKRSVRIRLEHLSDLMFDAAYYDWGISDAWKRNIPRLSADMARDPFVSPLVTTQGEPPVSLHSRVPLAPGEDIIELYTAVAQTGVPNYIGARIPVKTVRSSFGNFCQRKLQDPPEVFIPRPSVFAREGDLANLTCLVEGNPASTVTWRKLEHHHSLLGTERGNHLILRKVSRYDAGVYQCTADNGIPPVDVGTVTLQVRYPPWIDPSMKQTITVQYDNNDFSLDCLADGNPKPHIRWRRKDTNLYWDNPLRFNRVDYGVEGTYECVATNVGFPEVSKETKIDVMGLPHLLGQDLAEVLTVQSGGAARLGCRIVADPLPGRITWTWRSKHGIENTLHDGLNGISISEKISEQEMSSALTVKHVDIGRAGTYICQASNVFGPVKRNIQLEVKESKTSLFIIIIASTASALALMATMAFGCVLKKRRVTRKQRKPTVHGVSASRPMPPVPKYIHATGTIDSGVEDMELHELDRACALKPHPSSRGRDDTEWKSVGLASRGRDDAEWKSVGLAYSGFGIRQSRDDGDVSKAIILFF
uniref:Ig-like domain-containing protein n=1 Tax=Branchiostoma floridae TaxID=7739 RepID=C3YXQ6_BRAFL|eukprot:XP_002598853.1 hypothetical protein BRAFLDRAFT_74470 [Branchiostoma floridae]